MVDASNGITPIKPSSLWAADVKKNKLVEQQAGGMTASFGPGGMNFAQTVASTFSNTAQTVASTINPATGNNTVEM